MTWDLSNFPSDAHPKVQSFGPTATTTEVQTITSITAATDVIAVTNHGLADGDVIEFTRLDGGATGLTVGLKYYLVSTVANTSFKVSALYGGTAIDITADGTGTMQFRTFKQGWRPWYKPPGCVMVSFYVIGGGGAGGGARGNTAGAGKGGGSGGGSGGLSRVTIPAVLLPDVLWVHVPAPAAGGAGGDTADGTAGDPGLTSIVSVQPDAATQYLVCQARGGRGGGGGTTTISTGGAGGVVATTAECPISLLGTSLFLAGVAGATGASGASNGSGGDVSQSTGSQIYAGGGGGSSTTSTSRGGSEAALTNTPFVLLHPTNQNNTPGGDGARFGAYPKWYGASGGGANNTTTGQNGGNGSVHGAGGGGGGGGVTIGGRGGDGGPGGVVIHAWP
ncbi:MAG: hypothetical protein VW239_00770 [Candidatus Nanopelagicales bacterium]